MKIDKDDISIMILAGGAGRRVGGRDKGLLELNGKKLIEHQIHWAAKQTDNIIISANRSLEHYRKYNLPVVEDYSKDYLGPISGIQVGLNQVKTNWLWVQPIDLPCLPDNLLELLLDGQGLSKRCNYLISHEREHYLSMLISKTCLPSIDQFLKNKKSRVRELHSILKSKKINLGLCEDKFTNLNSLSDF